MAIEPTVLRKTVGRDIRAMREGAKMTQKQVSIVCGAGGRQWTHQVESGLIGISLENYLAIVDYLRDAQNADHPGHALSTHFKRRQQFVD